MRLALELDQRPRVRPFKESFYVIARRNAATPGQRYRADRRVRIDYRHHTGCRLFPLCLEPIALLKRRVGSIPVRVDYFLGIGPCTAGSSSHPRRVFCGSPAGTLATASEAGKPNTGHRV